MGATLAGRKKAISCCVRTLPIAHLHGQTVRYSDWAREYYQAKFKAGKSHAQILRALDFKWLRILWKCCRTARPTMNNTTANNWPNAKVPTLISSTLQKIVARTCSAVALH